MDVMDAIYSRRSIDQVKPDPLSRELIEKLLEAANQAPNHFKVRPWRFIVLQRKGLEGLGQAMARSLAMKHPELDPEALARESEKAHRAPVMIVVAAEGELEDKRVIPAENHSAAAAATQNLLLAAHALGLGVKWRTGPAAYDEVVKEYLELSEGQLVIAMLYVGYPAAEPAPLDRGNYLDRTTWIE